MHFKHPARAAQMRFRGIIYTTAWPLRARKVAHSSLAAAASAIPPKTKPITQRDVYGLRIVERWPTFRTNIYSSVVNTAAETQTLTCTAEIHSSSDVPTISAMRRPWPVVADVIFVCWFWWFFAFGRDTLKQFQ